MTPSFFLIHVLLLFVLGSSVRAEIPTSTTNGGEIPGPDADGVCYRGSPADDVIVPCPTRPHTFKVSTPIIVGIVVAVVLVLVLISVFLIWRRHVRAVNSASDNSHFDFVSTTATSTTKVSTHFRRPDSPGAFSIRSVLSRSSRDWPHSPVGARGSRWNMTDSRRSSRAPQVDIGMGFTRHQPHFSISSMSDDGLKKSAPGIEVFGSKTECKQDVEIYVLPATPEPIRRYSDVERELGRTRSHPPEW